MPRYNLLASKQVDKTLSKLDSKTRARIIEAIVDLENFPLFIDLHDLEKLKGRDGYYRIRVGDHRLIFKVVKEKNVIYLEKIGRRERVYDK